MQEGLATLIRNTAAQVRMRDYLWAIGISAGVGLGAYLSGGAALWFVLMTWGAFLAALALRYRFSAGRVWAEPIQRIVETELNAQEAELSTLRMARGVAQSLPEPLFILDANGDVELANPAAETFIGATSAEGRHFATVLRAPQVFEAAEQVLETREVKTVEFTTTGAVERSCRAYVAPLEAAGAAPRRVLVFIHDLTSERRLEQMRADFIASASHELRTPLSSVLGFIETLRGPAKQDVDAQESFYRSCRRKRSACKDLCQI